MASSTHCSRARRDRRPARRGWLLAAALLSAASAAADGRLEVRAVELTDVNAIVNVGARLDIALGDEVREALEHGVDLVFVVDTELRRRRRWVWDSRLARLQHRLVLQRHALSRQYVVDRPDSGQRQVFASLDEALAALGRLGPWPLVDAKLLEPGREYLVRVRARLDIDALPGPLQLVAWLTPGWRLSSGWRQVELAP